MSAKAIGWNQRTIDEFHAKAGRGVGMWGDNLLLMTARGAKSGDSITTPLVFRRDGGRLVVVASKGGAAEHPKWFNNLRANPEVELEIPSQNGTEQLRARASVLESGPERDRLYAYMAEVWPGFNDYQKKTSRTIPIVVLEPV